jgi:hypothetical protein
VDPGAAAEYLLNLNDSMPKKLQMVIEAKGGAIKN